MLAHQPTPKGPTKESRRMLADSALSSPSHSTRDEVVSPKELVAGGGSPRPSALVEKENSHPDSLDPCVLMPSPRSSLGSLFGPPALPLSPTVAPVGGGPGDEHDLRISTLAEQLQLTTPQGLVRGDERRPSEDRMSIYLQVFTSQPTGGIEEEVDTLHDLAETLAAPESRRISFTAGSKRPRVPSGSEHDYAEVVRQLGLEETTEEASESARTIRPEQQRRRADTAPGDEVTFAPPMPRLELPEPVPMPDSAAYAPAAVTTAAPCGAAGATAAAAAAAAGSETEVADVADLVNLPTMLANGLQWAPGVIGFAEPPAQQGRFRYAKEKRRTALPGRSPRSVPTVEVSTAWRSQVPEGSQVTATVVSRHISKRSGLPLPHWHHFDDAETSQTVVPLEDGQAEFPSLVVIRGDRAAHEASCVEASGGSVKDLPYSSDDQQVIRILFTIRFTDSVGQAYLAHAVSDPIFSSELKIVEMSHQQVCSTNGMDLIVLTSKVKKATAYLKITDRNPHGWIPDTKCDSSSTIGGLTEKPTTVEGWSLDEQNRPVCLVQPSYVHYQCSLSVRIPPYWQSGLQMPHTVEVRLIDSSQGLESAPVALEYVPKE